MTTEIICTLIALAGTLMSSIISLRVSRSAATKEIEKMRLEWEREDLVSSDDEFAEMAASVATLIKHETSVNLTKAAAQVTAIRSKESGDIAGKLDTLYFSLNVPFVASKTDVALTEVIEEKRKQKSQKQNRD